MTTRWNNAVTAPVQTLETNNVRTTHRPRWQGPASGSRRTAGGSFRPGAKPILDAIISAATGRRQRRRLATRTLGGFLVILLAGVLITPAARAGSTKTTEPPLRHMTVNLNDRPALRTGAMEFMHRCAACHSIQGTRFTALGKSLGLTVREVQRYLNTTGRRPRQTIVSSMPPALAKKFLHKAPPDLTVIAKRRGVDWLYTYLTSFYVDPSRPTGTNNVVFYNVAMPDVFASLQGLQAPVKKMGWRFGSRTKVAVGVKPLTKGAMSHAQFDQTARDIVSFLYLVAHPHQQERYALGPWILGLLGLLTALSYLLYRLYWRRVRRPEGPRWWAYWRRKR